MRLDAEDEQEGTEPANANSAPAVQPPSESRDAETAEGEALGTAESDMHDE